MPQSQDSYTPPGSDEALYRMMNPNLWGCQGHNLSTTMLTEALSTTTQPREEKKSNFGQIIKLEIMVSLILIGTALLVGTDSQTNRVEIHCEAIPKEYRDSLAVAYRPAYSRLPMCID